MSESGVSKQSSLTLALPILLVCLTYFHGLSAAYASSPQEERCQEEQMLSLALKKLKGQDLEGAIKALARLNKEFPGNEDYGLLYRMALKRQEAQQWYRYQDWAEAQHASNGGRKKSSPVNLSLKVAVNEPGRVNALKRATWLILATGKCNPDKKSCR